ncbi:hypothetical protein BDW22DRAFT_162331 [Trametopsis cervina]|nr:hypothetical protein BDW22DRAFT_162331 [Trametopsis cervina]
MHFRNPHSANCRQPSPPFRRSPLAYIPLFTLLSFSFHPPIRHLSRRSGIAVTIRSTPPVIFVVCMTFSCSFAPILSYPTPLVLADP